MLRIFKDELLNPKNFVVTLELVPGRESKARNTDTFKGIARDAFADGRISAVSITDNPEGNPSLSRMAWDRKFLHMIWMSLSISPGQRPPEKK